MFKKTDDPHLARRMNRFKRVFPSHSRGRFARFVRQFKPDAVLCTHYLPIETLGHVRREGRGRRSEPESNAAPFIVSVVTDFEAHALRMSACVDWSWVAAD